MGGRTQRVYRATNEAGTRHTQTPTALLPYPQQLWGSPSSACSEPGFKFHPGLTLTHSTTLGKLNLLRLVPPLERGAKNLSCDQPLSEEPGLRADTLTRIPAVSLVPGTQ